MKYNFTPLQKLAIAGLILFLPVSVLNAWLVIFKELYGVGDDYWFAIAFPFFTMFFSIVLWNVYSLIRLFLPLTKDFQWLKDHYPRIWEEVDPGAHFLKLNRKKLVDFLNGKYDDKKDESLNQIKFSMKMNGSLLVVTFLLAIVGVFASMAMIVLKDGGIRVDGSYIIKF
jgi:hypothetical protein